MKRLGRSLKLPPKLVFGQATRPKRADNTEETPERYLERLLASIGVEDKVPELEITYIPHYQIVPNPHQPRRRFDEAELEDLAESIRSAGGILQPLIVRKVASQRYEIVAGERRWRAAEIIDLEHLPCIVRDDLTAKQAHMVALIENIQRSDLNPMEEAIGLRRLIDEFGLSHLEAANAVGRSRSAVTNLLRLLELAESVQEALASGQIEMGHARALAGLNLDDQPVLLQRTLDEGWSVRQTEAAVRKWKEGDTAETVKVPYSAEQLQSTKDRLSAALGYEVTIKAYPSGKVNITFDTLRDVGLLLGEDPVSPAKDRGVGVKGDGSQT